MEYRELGKTGMNISNISLGASSLGGVFHAIKENAGIEAVYTAVDNGINFIDVSPYYGHLKAETVLGKALKNIERNRYYLSTKVGRYGKDGVNSWDYSALKAKTSVYESMERLHVDYIDLINIHDIEFADLEQICNETLPALVELRKEGIVKHVGITNLNLRHFKYVIDHVPAGTVESVLSFCHYTLNDDALADYLTYFESKDIGVINASPYSMGLLTERGVPDWHPAPEALKRLARRAVEYCKSEGVPIEQMAVSFSVANPRIATTLFSTANPENVLKTIRYATTPLNESLLEKVRKIFEPGYRDTWVNS
ncbi:aldo/keto reductase [Parabacteroides sp. AM08-6]|uniref:aldo/keto reductase n=1 Tax=Parabacteroides sp. AM08-6 TaxID=2292053 RepID=UPI000EFF2750|nr:aldo/keto reductase [Parabacteroides sp. AM08-6]RHJ78000.1 aldo/keto reductase [Parabacteroides sp. AM08-6]